ncbi:MAG: YcfL family protein [Deltaproteobacteria bacterium]|jgi:uncharacterized protein YcfL|nr:YcfL family protein [Deltaproteobacteria bacterium]
MWRTKHISQLDRSGPVGSVNPIKNAILLGLLSLLLLSLAACGQSKVEYADNEDVEIESINHKKDGDFLIVQAVLRNDDSDDVTRSVYRIEWYDESGFLLEKTSWRPILVKGGAPMPVRERSTIPGAVDYKLIISNDAS